MCDTFLLQIPFHALDPKTFRMMNGNYLAYSIFTAKCSPASQYFRKKALEGQFHFLFMRTVICISPALAPSWEVVKYQR